MKKQILAFLLSFTYIGSALGQDTTYIIPFSRKDNAIVTKFPARSILNVHKEENHDKLKGIQTSNPYSIQYVVAHQAVGNDIIGEKVNIYIYVELNKAKQEKYIIVDSNNNHDFSDDKVYTFSLKDYEIPPRTEEQDSLCPKVKVYVNSFELDLVINPFYSDMSEEKYKSKDEYYLETGVFTNFCNHGKINIGGKQILINENSRDDIFLFLPYNTINSSSRYYFHQATDTIITMSYSLGDTISLADRKVHLKAINNNKLYLEDIGSLSDSSYVGAYLPRLYANDLNNNIPQELNKLMTNKFVFIDIWGSWCKPCISSIPNLKEIYNKIKDREDVIMLGLALEHNEEGVEKLKSIIKEKEIEWPNFWMDGDKERELNAIIMKLRISSYPTYIIINNKGEIIYKEKSTSKTQEAFDFLLKSIEKEYN